MFKWFSKKLGHNKNKNRSVSSIPSLPDGTTIAVTYPPFIPCTLPAGRVPDHVKGVRENDGHELNVAPDSHLSQTSTALQHRTLPPTPRDISRPQHSNNHFSTLPYSQPKRQSSSKYFTLSSGNTQNNVDLVIDYLSGANSNSMVDVYPKRDMGNIETNNMQVECVRDNARESAVGPILRRDSKSRSVPKLMPDCELLEQPSTSTANPGYVMCTPDGDQMSSTERAIYDLVPENVPKTHSSSSGNSVHIDVRSSMLGDHKEHQLTIKLNTRDNREEDDYHNLPYEGHLQQPRYNCQMGDVPVSTVVEHDEHLSDITSADSGQGSLPGYRSRSVTDLDIENDLNGNATWDASMVSKDAVNISGNDISTNGNDILVNFTRAPQAGSGCSQPRKNKKKNPAPPPPTLAEIHLASDAEKETEVDRVQAVNEKLRAHQQIGNTPTQGRHLLTNGHQLNGPQTVRMGRHLRNNLGGRDSTETTSSTDFENTAPPVPGSSRRVALRLGPEMRRPPISYINVPSNCQYDQRRISSFQSEMSQDSDVDMRQDVRQRMEAKIASSHHQHIQNQPHSPRYNSTSSLPSPVTINGEHNSITINYNYYYGSQTVPTHSSLVGTASDSHQGALPDNRISVTLNGHDIPQELIKQNKDIDPGDIDSRNEDDTHM